MSDAEKGNVREGLVKKIAETKIVNDTKLN